MGKDRIARLEPVTCCVVDSVELDEFSKFGRFDMVARAGILHPLTGLFNFSNIMDGCVGTSAASLMSKIK